MQIETERKFLVLDDSYKAQAVESHRIRQGYIAHDMGRSVRVRILDDKGILTVKGPFIGVGSRPEWEKEISLKEGAVPDLQAGEHRQDAVDRAGGEEMFRGR